MANPESSPNEPRRTNVVLIMADQLRWDCIQPHNPIIKTPNIQRLADTGITFERTYAPTPVCAPCRGSILTGQYPSSHGLMHNDSFLPRDYFSSIGEIFTREGYYTHFIGKSHLNVCHDEASFESPPHVHNLDYFRKWHGPWYGFQHADINIGHTTERHAWGMHYGVWLEDHGVDIGKYFGNTAYTAYGAWDLPEEFHSSRWVAEVASNAIRDCNSNDQPFFLWVNFQDPHNPCMVPEPWASMYDPTEIPVYGYADGEPESFENKPPFYMEIISQKGGYSTRPKDPGLPGTGNVSSLKWTQRQVQENASAYYGMVSLLDKYVGQILDTLEETGERDNTIVVFTSDHGDLLGNHGMFWKSIVAFEDHMRVPFIVSYPSTIQAGQTSTALQNLVDLPPTFLSLIGAHIPYQFEGITQAPAWLDPARTQREFVVVEERPYDTDWNVRFIVTERFKLSFYAHRTYGELYDVVADPNHLHNLWADPDHAEVKQNLITKLLSHEMNKSAPRSGPSKMWRTKYPQYLTDFEEHLQAMGLLSATDRILTLNVALPMGGQRLPVALAEILESYLDVPLRLDLPNCCPAGILSTQDEEILEWTPQGDCEKDLIVLLGDLIGREIVLTTLLDEQRDIPTSKDPQMSQYRLVVRELFPA